MSLRRSPRLQPPAEEILDDGTPTPAKVGFRAIIRNVNDVDTSKQSCFVDVWVAVFDCPAESSDVDQRNQMSATAAFQRSYRRRGVTTQVAKDEWTEKFSSPILPIWSMTLLNAKKVKRIYKEKNQPTLRLFEDGRYYERQHIHAEFSQTFSLAKFPFDEQQMILRFSLDVGSCDAVFNDERKPDGTFKYLKVETDPGHFECLNASEWEQVFVEGSPKFKIETSLQSDSENPTISYSRIEIKFNVKRRSQHWMFTVFIPLIFIMLCSLLVYLFPISQSNEAGDAGKAIDEYVNKLSYLSTLLLSIIAVKFSIGDNLPRIPILTAMDKIFIACYVIIFIEMLVCAPWAVVSGGAVWSHSSAVLATVFIPGGALLLSLETFRHDTEIGFILFVAGLVCAFEYWMGFHWLDYVWYGMLGLFDRTENASATPRMTSMDTASMMGNANETSATGVAALNSSDSTSATAAMAAVVVDAAGQAVDAAAAALDIIANATQ